MNGLTIKLRGLINIGASSYVLIHLKYLRTIKKNLHTKLYYIEPILIAGYNSRPNS